MSLQKLSENEIGDPINGELRKGDLSKVQNDSKASTLSEIVCNYLRAVTELFLNPLLGLSSD